jgi:hypothetical protein
VAVIGTILIVMSAAMLVFQRPLTRLLVRYYTWHSDRYAIFYPGPFRRLVRDPTWVRRGLFFVAFAWTVIGVVEILASLD